MSRALEHHEEVAFSAVVEAAGVAVRSEKAWMELEWRERRFGPEYPELVVRPSNPLACPFSVTIDPQRIELHVDGIEWDVLGKDDERRAALLRDCVDAVVKGRYEVMIERKPARFRRLSGLHGWTLTGTFHVPAGPQEFTRAPVELEEYAAIFRTNGTGPDPEEAGFMGPRRYAAYWSPVDATSSTIVTGPSFESSTSMRAPNTPVATGAPSVASAARNSA